MHTRHPAYKLLAPAIAIAIFILSAQSTLPLPPTPFFSPDKVAHFIAYAVLAWAIAFWFPDHQWQKSLLTIAAAVAVIASLYGATDELHQYFVPGRDASIADWLADSLGAIVSAAVYALWTKRKTKSNIST